MTVHEVPAPHPGHRPGVPTMVRLEGVSRRYQVGRGTVHALSDVNLEIDRGEFTVVLRPSRSGKTTLLNLIGTLDTPSSKTVNLPRDATIESVRDIYLAAWHARLKGITVYRYGSRPSQALTFLSDSGGAAGPPIEFDADYAGGCAGYVCEL